MAKPFALPESPRIVSFVARDTVEEGLTRLPYLRALRHAFPTGHLTWLVGQGPSAFRGALAPLARGLIDRVIDTVPLTGRLTDLLAQPLPGEAVDLVIDGERGMIGALALKRIRSRHFLSASGDFLFSDRKPTQRSGAASQAAQLLGLVELATGKPARAAAPLALTQEVRAAARALLPRGPTYVGLAPGALDLSLAWPVNEYVSIARVLAQNGNVPVFFLGPPEQHWHEPIGAAVPTAYFPVQHPSVTHLQCAPHLCIALAERVGAMLANDGAFAHMAAAGGTPLVGLYGPTDPSHVAPAGARMIALRAQDYGSTDLAQIPATAVLQAIQRMLWSEGRSQAS